MAEEIAEKYNILLVDDDKFLVDMYSMKFTSRGYNVNACLSISDALQVLRDGFKPAVVVFDIIMPEHDGFYFLTTLVSENLRGGASLIALTNESDDATQKKLIEMGVDRVIVKASTIPSEVVETVRDEIARKKA
jgi:PleD family two-component response regulator